MTAPLHALERLHLDDRFSDLHLEDRLADLRLGDHLGDLAGRLDHLPVDPARIGAAVESVVDVVTETIADDLMPVARRTVRRSRRIVTRHPRAAIGTVAAVGVFVLVLVWLRRRDRAADDAVVTGLRRDAA